MDSANRKGGGRAESVIALTADGIVTVEMMKNIIANIQVGHVTIEDRRGEVLDTDRALVFLTLRGSPDGELTLDRTGSIVKSNESLYVRRG